MARKHQPATDTPDLFAEVVPAPTMVEAAPEPQREVEDPQIARIRKWDFRRYDSRDAGQRTVVEDMLRTPLPRVK